MNTSELNSLSLRELIDRLSWYDAGHLSHWNLDTRGLRGIISVCCEELDNLAYRADVIGWCQELSASSEGVGEGFHRGVQLMADEIKYRLRLVQAIIRKALAEMPEGKP